MDYNQNIESDSRDGVYYSVVTLKGDDYRGLYGIGRFSIHSDRTVIELVQTGRIGDYSGMLDSVTFFNQNIIGKLEGELE